MLSPLPSRKEPSAKPQPLYFDVFARNNWAGTVCFKVDITYANGSTRSLAPEFKDEDRAFSYMGRFHSSIPKRV